MVIVFILMLLFFVLLLSVVNVFVRLSVFIPFLIFSFVFVNIGSRTGFFLVWVVLRRIIGSLRSSGFEATDSPTQTLRSNDLKAPAARPRRA